MFEALSRWRRRRVLQRVAIPDALWRDALASLPFLAIYDAGRKSTTIARKLRDVEALPELEADRLLTGEGAGVLLEGEVADTSSDAPQR